MELVETIVTFCEMDELELRSFLIKNLVLKGFSLKRDNYKSSRNPSSLLGNMLFIRGNPKICFVAHTDVCRDHSFMKANGASAVPSAVVRVFEDADTGELKTIIHDEECKTQLGGDDRLGVALIYNLIMNTDKDVAALFTTDEEIGTVSAAQVSFNELLEMDLLVQIDRGNHSNQLVNSIYGQKICSDFLVKKLCRIAVEIGHPRDIVEGMLTDVATIIENGVARNAVNMTCGYHNSYGSAGDEYIDVKEALETKKFMKAILDKF